MSLTARERANPPPRRKSCSACTKAKRRCDFALPACLRCSQRLITCEYPSRPALARRGRSGAQQQQQQQQETSDGQEMREEVEDDDPDIPFEIGLDTVDNPAASCSSEYPGLAFLDIMPETDFAIEVAARPVTALSPPSSKEFDSVAESIARRLQYAIDQIQLAPGEMACDLQTPWCHARLWKDDMPPAIHDAFTSCAVYMAKTRANAQVVLRSIESRASALVSSPTPLTAKESLAHTQALLLYQIIRLFDGDIRTRASAERAMGVLENSAVGLLSFADFGTYVNAPAEFPLYPLTQAKSFWHEWIFQESLRRTMLFTLYFLQIYRILAGHKGLYCDGKLCLVHSWTLSAHLWYAKSPVEFAEAWKEKNHFVVTNAQFGTVLQEAQAHDIDAFGRIFISSLLGIEEAEGWFASRGGSLRQVRAEV